LVPSPPAIDPCQTKSKHTFSLSISRMKESPDSMVILLHSFPGQGCKTIDLVLLDVWRIETRVVWCHMAGKDP